MILGKKLVMSNFLKASFIEKLTSRAELFEPKSEPSRAKNEPSLGSGATLVSTLDTIPLTIGWAKTIQFSIVPLKTG